MNNDNILSIESLNIEFTQLNQKTNPVKNINFFIKKGEMLAIVGESGSGKSLSALSILRLLPSNASITGKINFQNKNILEMSEKDLLAIRGHKISMIFQEPMTSLNPLHTIEKQISEVLFLHQGLNKQDARNKVCELLLLVGLQEPEKRLNAYPHNLSGGQRQRVMIAMALANNPDLLIADEPTTALDVTLQAQILALLKSLQKKLGLAILFITHDLRLVKRYADRVAVMQEGHIIETNNTANLFLNPQQDYTRELLEAEPNTYADPHNIGLNTVLDIKNISIDFPLKKNFWGKVTESLSAVHNVSLNLKEGESLGIVGESGSGKSTLAMSILRLLNHTKGTITLLNTDIENLSQKELRPLRKDLQIVFQDPYGSLSPRLTVGDIIAEGLIIQGLSADEQEQQVIAALKSVELDPLTRFRYPHEFSGGQRQRIAIARAIALKPKIIILDEPTSALDRTVQKQIILLLQNLQKDYQLSYIFISHDLSVIRALCHRIMVMKSGHVIETQSTDNLFQHPQHSYTKELLTAADLNTWQVHA